jgi:hypothetical protein
MCLAGFAMKKLLGADMRKCPDATSPLLVRTVVFKEAKPRGLSRKLAHTYACGRAHCERSVIWEPRYECVRGVLYVISVFTLDAPQDNISLRER